MISDFSSGVAVGWAYSYTSGMCTDKDHAPCEHDDLQVEACKTRSMTATNEELRQLAAAQRAGKRHRLSPKASGSQSPVRGESRAGSFSYRKPAAVDELTEPRRCRKLPRMWRHTRMALRTGFPRCPDPRSYRVQNDSGACRVAGVYVGVIPTLGLTVRVGRRVMAAAHAPRIPVRNWLTSG